MHLRPVNTYTNRETPASLSFLRILMRVLRPQAQMCVFHENARHFSVRQTPDGDGKREQTVTCNP